MENPNQNPASGWDEKAEAEFLRMKELRRAGVAALRRQRTQERKRVYEAKRKADQKSIVFRLDKALADHFKNSGDRVSKVSEILVGEAAIYAIRKGISLKEAADEALKIFSAAEPDISQGPSQENPQIDPGVFDALSN